MEDTLMAIVKKNQIIFRKIKVDCYKHYCFLDECMEKYKRGHSIVVLTIESLDNLLVAIPLRSKLKPFQAKFNYIIPYKEYEDKGTKYLKGMDLSKLLIVKEEHIDLTTTFQLDKEEKDFYLANKNKIFGQIKRYLTSYKNGCNKVAEYINKNESFEEFSELPINIQRFVRNYKYSTLRNFQDNLKIESITIEELRDFLSNYI